MTNYWARARTDESGRCELDVGGDVDVEVADELAQLALLTLRDDRVRVLVFDLGAVTFLDSSGLSALIRARNAGLSTGKSVSLRALPARVVKVLRISGLDGVFVIE